MNRLNCVLAKDRNAHLKDVASLGAGAGCDGVAEGGDDVDVRRSKLVHRAVGGWVVLLGGHGDYGDDLPLIFKDRQTETWNIEALVVDDYKITLSNGVSTAP